MENPEECREPRIVENTKNTDESIQDSPKNVDIDFYKKKFAVSLVKIVSCLEVVNTATILALLGLVIYFIVK